MGDVTPRDHEILAPVVHTADDDVGMRMGGVVVVDGDPVELGAEIRRHLLHEVSGEGLEVLELVGVLGGDDEAELVAVVLAAFDEGPASRGMAGLDTVPPEQRAEIDRHCAEIVNEVESFK